MNFARFLILLLITLTLVQFSSSDSSSDPSSAVSSTTSKPKTSFTRHFTKIFSPFKKLFSSKPKTSTPSSQLSNVTEQPDRASSRESIDQPVEANVSLTADPDSVDFNLTEEANQPEIKLVNLPNSTEDSGKTDDLNADETNKIESKIESKEPAKKDESNKENSSSSEDYQQTSSMTSEGQFTVQSTTPATFETTTNSVYKKLPQTLTEDEMRICFEIEELNVRKCYIQIPTVSNFVHSRNYCETHFNKGRLITINTVDEQNFLILNAVYYFWTAFKVKLGLTSSLTPYVAAIRPIYKQSNASIELIEKFRINQNLVVSEAELKQLTSGDKFASYPTNDDDSYEEDDIRLEEPEQIYVLIPKVYCLEASLNFENGQPLYKWVIKDCDQETSSSVCEFSEPLVEENTELVTESTGRPESGERPNGKPTNEPAERAAPQSNEQNALVDEKVNQLVNLFLSGSSNQTKSVRPPLATEPTNIEFRTESAEDEHFKEILSDLLKEVEAESSTQTATQSTTQSATQSTTQMASTLAPESTTSTSISTTTESSFTTDLSTSEQSTTEQSTERSSTTESTTTDSDRLDETTTVDPRRPANSTANCTVAEQNPLIYQLMFAANIAFNSFCSLVANLFSRGGLDDKQLNNSKLIFLSAVILLLLLLLTTVLLIVLVTCRYALRMLRRKRRLLLDTLSEQRYLKKDELKVAIDKKFDDESCYYNINIPHNRNIYVAPPESRQYLLPNNTEKYKSIPKEYFY